MPSRAETRLLLARWKASRRARRFYEWGRAVEVASPGAAVAQRAARLYQRGLRILQPSFPAGIPGQGLTSRDRLEWALAMSVPWRGLSFWPRRRRIVATTIAAGVVAITIGLLALASWLGSPRNLAVGKPWRASSVDAGFPSAGRIEEDAAPTMFMHTAEEEKPSLVIDLESVRAVGGFEIDNRGDCCAERTVPLAVETSGDGKSWTLVARRTSGFSTWMRHFAPVPARFVRIQTERRSILHLARVRIHGR